jgi:hypothetical protein
VQDVRFQTRHFQARAAGGLSYYHFPVQTIDVPPAPTLHLATVNASLRLERQLYKTLRAFGSFEFEQTTSNDPSSEYRVMTYTGGVSWEF